jgi:NADP-dependent 3-hydroxy acid dehydrogenase YdfG
MKIAITGHTNGIGQALAREYQQRGHKVMGLSRRTGQNIHLTEKITNAVADCDVFVNNAQSGFAQTQLLWNVAQRWQNTGKSIVVISTMMAQDPVSVMPGYDMAQYRVQKVALEESVRQLRLIDPTLKIYLVRPGDIATTPEKTVPPSADLELWTRTLMAILYDTDPSLQVYDISLGPSYDT